MAMNYEQVCREYLAYEQNARALSMATIQAQKNDLRLFEEGCKEIGRTPFDLDEAGVQAVIDRLMVRYENASVARLCSTIRSFYLFLNLRFDFKDITLSLRSPSVSRHLPSWIGEKQMDEILESFDNDERGILDRTILMTLYCTGLRVSELCTLEDRRVALDQHSIRVIGKGDKERIIPISNACARQMKEYRDTVRSPLPSCSGRFFVTVQGKPLNRQYVYRLCKKVAMEHSLSPSTSAHTLRHSYATRLVEHEVDLRTVQELLGHSDISTTQIYTHIDSHRLRQTVDSALPDLFGNTGRTTDSQVDQTGEKPESADHTD